MTQSIDDLKLEIKRIIDLKLEIKRIIENAKMDIEDIEVEDVDDIDDLNIKNDDFKVISVNSRYEDNYGKSVRSKLEYKQVKFGVYQYFTVDMNREYDLTEIVVTKI